MRIVGKSKILCFDKNDVGSTYIKQTTRPRDRVVRISLKNDIKSERNAHIILLLQAFSLGE